MKCLKYWVLLGVLLSLPIKGECVLSPMQIMGLNNKEYYNSLVIYDPDMESYVLFYNEHYYILDKKISIDQFDDLLILP